mgnify:CR=1 FL=1
MKQEAQQLSFSEALTSLTDRYTNEFDLTYESMIGVMEMHKLWLVHTLYEEQESEEPVEDEDDDGETWKEAAEE